MQFIIIYKYKKKKMEVRYDKHFRGSDSLESP